MVIELEWGQNCLVNFDHELVKKTWLISSDWSCVASFACKRSADGNGYVLLEHTRGQESKLLSQEFDTTWRVDKWNIW